MALPIFFTTIEETIDSESSGLPIVKLLTSNKSLFGGAAAKSHILPDNIGGSVSIAHHIGTNNSVIYNAKTDIIAKMALLYNAHGGVVTPIFGQAVTSSIQPFNFAGIALTSTKAVSDDWDHKFIINGTLSPTSRDSFNLVYVEETQKVFLFGGENNGIRLGDNWEWDGISWTQKILTSPTARSDFAIANGTINSVNKTIMFGGYDGSILNQTWWYTNNSWIQQSPATSPSPRIAHSMIYDSNRHVMVMFGGFNHGVYNNETWEYDGTNWVHIFTANSPPIRSGHVMAYDTFRNKTILFGGRENSTFYGDTWEYDGINWTERFLEGQLPISRDSARLVFNATEKKAIMFGGLSSSFDSLRDTWQYDGTEWTQINTFGPSSRYSFGMTYSPNEDKAILFGGSNSTVVGALGETWEFGSLLRPVKVQTSGDGYVYWDASPGRAIPMTGDFLGPSSVFGTVTPLYDGYSPVFGVAVEGPVIDQNNAPAPFTIVLNGNSVGIIKLRIRPFYGFIPPQLPSITDFIPSSGIVGDVIKLDGYVFIGTSELSINDGYGTTATYSVISNNQITFIVPDGAQKGTITVTNAQGNSTSIAKFVTLPIITSVNASSFSIGSSVVIHGHTFTYATSITFNGIDQPIFTIDNDTQITTTIPVSATTGTITLSITYVPGDVRVATYPNFGVVAPPVINNISPLSGPIGAAAFTTLNGAINNNVTTITVVDTTGFISPGIVVINSEQISYTGTSPTTFTGCVRGVNSTIPTSHLTNSAVSSAIVNPHGYLSIVGTGFMVNGTQLDGYGTVEFIDVATMTQILPATRTIFNDTTISAIVPNPGVAQPSKAYYIRITTDGGVVISSQQFTIIPPPKFLDAPGPTFISQSGNAQGIAGSTVRIFGDYGFTGTSRVTFDGYISPSTHFVNDGYITAVVPSVSSAIDITGPISVVGIGGTKSTSDAPTTNPINFTILQQPTITSFSPPSGKTGDTISIFGSNLLAIDSIAFETDAYCSFTVISSERVDVVVPAGGSGILNAPTIIHITINKGPFSVATSSTFLYYPSPASLSISSPAQVNGINGGYGTLVALTGSQLNQGGPPTITFGGVLATISGSALPSSVSAIVPVNAGNNIALTTLGGTTTLAFVTLGALSISSFYTDYPSDHHSATSSPASIIDIYGSNFTATGMSIYIVSPRHHPAMAQILISSYIFYDSTHIRFSAATLGSFTGETCYIQLTTSYPGGTYTASVNGLAIVFVVL